MKAPVGPFSVSLNGIELPPTAMVNTNDTYAVKVNTLAGLETIDSSCAAQFCQTASDFARRVQIAGTIQAIKRRGLQAEYDALAAAGALDHEERNIVYSTDPKLGTVLGVGIAGKYGQPLADAAGSLDSVLRS